MPEDASPINGTCIGGSGGGVGLGNPNAWTALQTFNAGLIAQASSTIVGPLTITGVLTLGTGTTTTSNGINLNGGCFSLNGTCIGGSGGGVGLGNPNAWTALQTFNAGLIAQASSTIVGPLTITGVLTLGTGTTTTSNGINLNGGCFSLNGTCITGGGGPTYTFSYPLLNTSNTISLGFGTTTANSWSQLQTFGAGASTTNLVISNLGNTGTNCLQVSALGVVSTTGAPCGGSGSVPGGLSGQIQFNSSNTFSGASNLWWNSSTNSLGIGSSSPSAELSIATPVADNTTPTALFPLFNVASSTSVGTTTLFSVDSGGDFVSTLANASSTFSVGANNSTNPAFQIVNAVGGQTTATGLQLVSEAAGSGVNLNTISSATNEALNIYSKGNANLNLNSGGNLRLMEANVQQLTVGGAGSFFTPGVRSSNGSAAFSVTTAADTGINASTEAPEALFNFNQTHLHLLNPNQTGILQNRDFLIDAATHTFSATTTNSSRTITDAATLGVTGAPMVGTNARITNANTLELDASTSQRLHHQQLRPHRQRQHRRGKQLRRRVPGRQRRYRLDHSPGDARSLGTRHDGNNERIHRFQRRLVDELHGL